MTTVRPRQIALFVALFVVLVAPAPAPAQQLFTYNFNNGTANLSSGSAAYITAMSAVTTGNTQVGQVSNTAPTSSGYSWASGGNYFGVTTVSPAFLTPATTSYFSLTITPNSSLPLSGFALSDFDVGVASRLNGGARTFALRSSADGFASNLWTTTVAADSVWRGIDGSFPIQFYNTTSPVELRLYAYNPNGLTELGELNTRIDDIRITLYAVPEPGTILGVAAAALGAARVVRRRRANAAA